MTREELADRAHGYLAALDRLDVEAVLAFFSDETSLAIRTAHQEFTGKEQIRTLWQKILPAHSKMRHTVTDTVVDEDTGTIVTVQSFRGELASGGTEERCSVYVFEIDEFGMFSRVAVWIDGATPAQP
jgi:ketosteroid isomerase-like protein